MGNAGSEPPQKASSGLAELVGRALTDSQFRERLYNDQRSAAEEYQLSSADREALQSISQKTMEDHARQFGTGSAAAMTISIVIKIRF